MISADSITKRFGKTTALEAVSFDVPNGVIVGLLGQNGAGKSTLLNIMSGYMAPSSGHISIEGVDMQKEPLLAKSKIGYLPERPPLYPEMTVAEYLAFCASLKGVVKVQVRDHIREIAELTGLKQHMHRPIGNLSKGYQQRTGLAQALCGNPSVLLLDEPTNGFDPSQTAEFRTLVRGLSKRHTVIFSSHLLGEIQAVCDRVMIVHHGRLVYDLDDAMQSDTSARGIRLRVLLSKEKLLPALRSLQGVLRVAHKPTSHAGTEVLLQVERQSPFEERLAVLLSGLQAPIMYLAPMEDSLEDTFLRLTSAAPGEVRSS